MSIVTVTRTLPVDVRSTWAALADFGGIHRFHPYVDRSPLLNDTARGEGAERRCEFSDGNHICERVIQWDEGKSMTVDIYDGSMPLARAQGSFTVTPTDSGTGSLVSFTMDYKPKMGPLGAVMDALMMRRKFRKMMNEILEGLESFLTEAPPAGVVAVAV